MSPRLYIAITGGVLAVVGFFALLFPVTLASDSLIIESIECGNGFGMVSEKPIGAPDNWRTTCDSAVSTRQGWSWGLLGVGVLTTAGGLFVRTTPAKRDEGSPTQPA
ncbi:hypothetical protein Lesp02_70660 [Lentzea sp. NBRC 105346]|uniref:hypothetical protein n=1 Tax=Lentzea sp. NBRC 105346 TaxID=3032205 RepID=UPI0024A36AF6|nr:hypothetical protein [Lentzea sp. NBRC 105346]GLZ34879.1 hypothetical protein Lesp02_70660 [Lentzea sp. NBRC 105346]